MRGHLRAISVALACLLVGAAVFAQSPVASGCRPSPGSSSPSPTLRYATPTVSQSVACGTTVVTVAETPPPATNSASAVPGQPPKAEPASQSASAVQARLELLRYGMFGAGALIAVAILLMIAGFFMAFRVHGIAVNRDNIRFGGAGRGWEASPAFVALIASVVIALLGVVLALQVLERGDDSKNHQSQTEPQKPKAS